MKNVISFLFVLSVFTLTAQTSDALKREQQLLEKKIANTKLLLDKSKSRTELSLNELQVIKNQISYREDLIRNFDNQIRSGEIKIRDKEQQITNLKNKVVVMKDQYKKLLLYAYKRRNKYGRMLYIFSSKSYNEALRRNRYVKGMEDLRRKQFEAIRLNQEFIKSEIVGIEEERKLKIKVLSEKKQEREEIEKDKLAQEQIYNQLKNEETALLEKLRRAQQTQQALKEQINAAIRREIAEAEAQRKREEEARRKKEALANNNSSNSDNTKTTNTNKSTDTPAFTETKESILAGKSFESNKGRLPWPVEKGTVTEKFGVNPHPTLKNVQTDNTGIDITAPSNSHVRAVYEGEVTSVFYIQGAGTVVIIRHGNYRTVYGYMKDVYVTKGDKVSTKKVIGSLVKKEDENYSIMHFEIRAVNGTNITQLNPSLWIAQ